MPAYIDLGESGIVRLPRWALALLRFPGLDAGEALGIIRQTLEQINEAKTGGDDA